MSVWRDATSGMIVRDTSILRCAECPCDEELSDCSDCDVPLSISVTVSGWTGFMSQFNGTYVIDWVSGCFWQGTFTGYEGRCDDCDPEDVATISFIVEAYVFLTSPVRWQVALSEATTSDVPNESMLDGENCVADSAFFTPDLLYNTDSGVMSDQCSTHTLYYAEGSGVSVFHRDDDCVRTEYTIPHTVTLTI